MKVVLIAAMAANRVIGINNTLPWKLSADLKRFKALTTGHTIVMGRKTFESLGRPLPGRRHICVSRSYSDKSLQPDPRWPEQVFWCGDLFSALMHLRYEAGSTVDACYVIGGAEIYTQALACADELELTHIHREFSGDAWFPAFDSLYKEEERSTHCEGDLTFDFVRYTSIRPHAVTVRKATAADADFIASAQIKMALESESLRLQPNITSAGVRAVLNDPAKGSYLIAVKQSVDGDLPVACLLVQKEWSDWRNGMFHWIHSLYVEPEHRRKGICRWILKVAQSQAQTESALGLRLYVDKRNQSAQLAYSECGMTSGHYDLFEIEF